MIGDPGNRNTDPRHGSSLPISRYKKFACHRRHQRADIPPLPLFESRNAPLKDFSTAVKKSTRELRPAQIKSDNRHRSARYCG